METVGKRHNVGESAGYGDDNQLHGRSSCFRRPRGNYRHL